MVTRSPVLDQVPVPAGTTEDRIRRRVRRALPWVPWIGVMLGLALLCVGSWLYAWDSTGMGGAYSVHPFVFKAQKERVKVGMTRAQVATVITRFDDHSTAGGSEYFGIMPKSLYPLRPYLYLQVRYDAKGRVVSISLEDG